MGSLFFAQLFGIVSIVMALGILFNIDNSKKLVHDMIHNTSGYVVGGILPLIFGTWVMIGHPHGTGGWTTIVTLIGLLMCLVGIFRLWLPNLWVSVLESNKTIIPYLFSLFGLILGLLLLYIGFIEHHI